MLAEVWMRGNITVGNTQLAKWDVQARVEAEAISLGLDLSTNKDFAKRAVSLRAKKPQP